MELKRIKINIEVFIIFRFNRTFMELKHMFDMRYINFTKGFNRTFMELKQISSIIKRSTRSVLIGPSWN